MALSGSTSLISVSPTAGTSATEKISGRVDARLQDACEQFESYFIAQLMSETQAQLPRDGIIPRSDAQQTFQEMLNQTYAAEMSHAHGFGLAEMLYRQIGASNGDQQGAATIAPGGDRPSLANFSKII